MSERIATEMAAQTDALREIRDTLQDVARAMWTVAAVDRLNHYEGSRFHAGNICDEAKNMQAIAAREVADASND